VKKDKATNQSVSEKKYLLTELYLYMKSFPDIETKLKYSLYMSKILYDGGNIEDIGNNIGKKLILYPGIKRLIDFSDKKHVEENNLKNIGQIQQIKTIDNISDDNLKKYAFKYLLDKFNNLKDQLSDYFLRYHPNII
jgi:hypothetical protein